MIIYHRYKAPRRCLLEQQNIYRFNVFSCFENEAEETGVDMKVGFFRNNGCLLVSNVLTKKESLPQMLESYDIL